MTQLQTLALYTFAILAGALVGGSLPLIGRIGRSDIGLSFSAGVMLGAAFLHMLPEAVEEAGAVAAPFVMVGFLLLYLLERFVLIHICAEPGPNARLSAAGEPQMAVVAQRRNRGIARHLAIDCRRAFHLPEGCPCSAQRSVGPSHSSS